MPAAALELPGVVGVLTGAERSSRCRGPFRRASREACRTTQLPPTSRATWASRSPSSSPSRATSPRTPRSSSRSTTTRSTRRSDGARALASPTAPSTRRSRPRDVVVEGRYVFPRWSCTPVECYGVVADWRGDGLTAWANFQGPFTLHAVAAAALGPRGSKLRLITPPDSGGSFGIKSSVFAYVVLLGLARASSACPCAGPKTASSTWRRARTRPGARPSSTRRSPTTASCSASATTSPRTSARTSARRSRRRCTACTARLSGAYRVRNVATRNRVVLTNRCPTGLNRGFGGPQLYLPLERTMDSRGGRLGLDPAELRRRNLVPEFPYTTPSGGIYDVGRLRGRARRGARARALRRAACRAGRRARRSGSASPASSSRRSRTWATSRSPRRRPSAPRLSRSRGTSRAARSSISPARRDRGAALDDAAGPGAPHGRRADRRRPPRRRARGRRRDRRAGHLDERLVGRVRRVLVAVQRRRCGRGRGGRRPLADEDRGDPRPCSARTTFAAPRGRHVPLESRVAAGRAWSLGSRRRAFYAAPHLAAARRRRSRRVVRRARLRRRRRGRRGRRATPARCACSTT